MKAVILAAGKGTRLKPITESIPKAMVDIEGKPMLERIILQLKDKGFKEFIVVVGYKKEMVESHFKDGGSLDVHIQYAEQEKQLGTGHAVLQAEPFLKGEKEFLLVFADTCFDTHTLDAFIAAKTPGVIGVAKVADPRQYGVVELDKDGFVKNIIEKPEHPPTDLAVAGIHKLPVEIFDALRSIPLSPRGEYELWFGADKLFKAGVKFSTITIKDWKDVGNLKQLEEARELAKKK